VTLALSQSFRQLEAPGTGRRLLQLTTGPGFCYPLYYYVPSVTQDNRYVVYHEAAEGEVQLHRVDLATGDSLQLTHASGPDTWWRPWCTDAGSGVLDFRSALNVPRGEVVFFDGVHVRAVEVASGATRDLFDLPTDRLAIGQNCVTPDGQWFVYIHADRETYQRMFDGNPDYDEYWRRRERARATHLAAYNFDTGEHRTILVLASPIHHVLPYNDRDLLFCHPTAENGMLLTDIEGGWYTHLRTQDEAGGQICHFVATARGATYEVLWGAGGLRGGICDPLTRATYEIKLPASFEYVHTGLDPAGLLWFYENHGPDTHDLQLLERHDPAGSDTWLTLAANWPTYGDQDSQKAHFHPQVVLERRWILMTGGDAATETNQVFLLDISDLSETRGIPWPAKASATLGRTAQ
jgi:hypothetical protein